MKAYYKIYIFYAALTLIGASLSAGVYFAYGICVFPTEAIKCGTSFDLSELIELTALFLKPLALVFFCAFTLYSCFICSTVCVYVGAVLGRLTIKYCLSSHSFFTHGAVLLLLTGFLTVFTAIAKEAAICRSALLTAAPDPSRILKTDVTLSFIKAFAAAAAAVMAMSLATYILLIYFPI